MLVMNIEFNDNDGIEVLKKPVIRFTVSVNQENYFFLIMIFC